MSVQVYPSILSADFGALSDEAQRIEKEGADAIHIDIMDGHFVPNLTFGPKAVEAIRRSTSLFLDVHLMIYHPFDFIETFIRAGADRITFHFEATEDVEDTLQFIRKCGKQAGLAFRPETSFSMVVKYLYQTDLILLMTVNPGFGGQTLIPDVVEKIKLTREYCNRHRIGFGGQTASTDEEFHKMAPFLIQVDGGINEKTAPHCIRAGANVLVSGDFLFRSPSLAKGIQQLRGK
jgi:ribulose-phosphate 3-epimerase